MDPVTHGRGWQEFVNHLAERQDLRRRKQDMVGTVLWAVVAAAVVLMIFCLILQSAGWL